MYVKVLKSRFSNNEIKCIYFLPRQLSGIAPGLRLGFGSRSVGNQTIASEKSCSRLGLGFGLGSVLGLGGNIFPPEYHSFALQIYNSFGNKV